MEIYNYKFTLERVIDGDTLVGSINLGFNLTLNRQHIRLLEIDAPEVRGKSKNLGIKVKNTLIEFLVNKELIIKSNNYDSFGRVLAHVYYLNSEDNQWYSLNKKILSYIGVQKYNLMKQPIKFENEKKVLLNKEKI